MVCNLKGKRDPKTSYFKLNCCRSKENIFLLDIALIHLPKKFSLKKYINTIEMNTNVPNGNYVGKYLSVSGWGITDLNKFEHPQKLMAVDLLIVKTGWTSVNSERVLQASQTPFKGVCTGDSGGIKA